MRLPFGYRSRPDVFVQQRKTDLLRIRREWKWRATRLDILEGKRDVKLSLHTSRGRDVAFVLSEPSTVLLKIIWFMANAAGRLNNSTENDEFLKLAECAVELSKNSLLRNGFLLVAAPKKNPIFKLQSSSDGSIFKPWTSIKIALSQSRFSDMIYYLIGNSPGTFLSFELKTTLFQCFKRDRFIWRKCTFTPRNRLISNWNFSDQIPLIYKQFVFCGVTEGRCFMQIAAAEFDLFDEF